MGSPSQTLCPVYQLYFISHGYVFFRNVTSKMNRLSPKRIQWIEIDAMFFFVFLKLFEDMSPFCGATDAPVLDFWWRLPWVSKPGWISCVFLACVILRFTSGAAPADWIEVIMAAEPFWSTTCRRVRKHAMFSCAVLFLFDKKPPVKINVNLSENPWVDLDI